MQKNKQPRDPQLNGPRRVAFLALFTALAVSTNYLMFPFWNIKLMDLLVFVSGYWLGIASGAVVALMVWSVYGILNPLGFSLFVLLTVAPMEMIYGIIGGLRGRNKRDISVTYATNRHFNLYLGVIGLISTFIYDIVTNLVSGITFTNTLWPGVVVGLLTMNFPIPMGLIHEVSNFFLFAFLAPIIILRISSFLNFYPGYRSGVQVI